MRRLLPDSNCCNMRELGGFYTEEGKLTKYKRFIRSDLPYNLTNNEIQTLLNYGITTVIDLRSLNEVNLRPNSLTNVHGIQYLNVSLNETIYGKPYFNLPINERYIRATKENINLIGKVFNIIANAKEGTILIQCSAGKDRTGTLVTLLLMLAGVYYLDIIADYQVSNTYLRGRKILNSSLNLKCLLDDDTTFERMDCFIKFINTEYNGIYNFLFIAAGVSDENIIKVKSKLID